MATRTLEQTIKELESRIECPPYGDLSCDVLDFLKEYSSKKDELEEELQKSTLEACKTVEIARILTELIEEKSSEVEESDEDVKYEEPPLVNPPDFVPLDFRRLSEMIGQPIYIKDHGCKGHWEILTAVKKDLDGEVFAVRGNNRWQRIGNCIYRTKEGAYEDS